MNSNLLKGKIKEKNMSQGDVAELIGLSLSRFNAKINTKNGAVFTLGEARSLRKVLSLTEEQFMQIFFS